MNGTPPTCGAQQAGQFSKPFDWWLFGAGAIDAALLAWFFTSGVPLANNWLHAILGYNPITNTTDGAWIESGAAAGALIVLTIVGYYLFTDGCNFFPPKSVPACVSGIVNDVTDLNSTAVNILAPFAIGPEAMFDVVVKSTYWSLVTNNAYWVYCSNANPPGAELRCFVKSVTACAAKIGSAVGALAGAVPGVVLGYLAGIAVASLGCGPFAFLCFLLACIVAAIVAAAITYAGAVIGGDIAEGIAAAASGDPLGATAKSLVPGTIVTVNGDLAQDQNVGNNELWYVTSINRTGMDPSPPDYTTAQADNDITMDDCSVPTTTQ
jgi:hypothetical protein